MNQDIHTHLEKLKTELNKLEPAVTHLQKADETVKSLQNITDKLLPMVIELQKENEKLAKSNSKLIDKIDKVDFPSRFDKVDATVSSINQGLQNTQTRIGDLEENLKDDIQAKTKEVTAKVEASENSTKQRIDNTEKGLNNQLEKISKENKLLKIILFVSIGLTIGLIVFMIIFGT